MSKFNNFFCLLLNKLIKLTKQLKIFLLCSGEDYVTDWKAQIWSSRTVERDFEIAPWVTCSVSWEPIKEGVCKTTMEMAQHMLLLLIIFIQRVRPWNTAHGCHMNWPKETRSCPPLLTPIYPSDTKRLVDTKKRLG